MAHQQSCALPLVTSLQDSGTTLRLFVKVSLIKLSCLVIYKALVIAEVNFLCADC